MANSTEQKRQRWTIAAGPRVFGGHGRATGPDTNGMPVEVMPTSALQELAEELERVSSVNAKSAAKYDRGAVRESYRAYTSAYREAASLVRELLEEEK